jgi:transcriptional regulator of arginine metabolism
MDTVGDHLIVVKTPPGQASMLALAVDREKIPGVAGTVAGDDTFFVAVKSRSDQLPAVKHIRKLMMRS